MSERDEHPNLTGDPEVAAKAGARKQRIVLKRSGTPDQTASEKRAARLRVAADLQDRRVAARKKAHELRRRAIAGDLDLARATVQVRVDGVVVATVGDQDVDPSAKPKADDWQIVHSALAPLAERREGEGRLAELVDKLSPPIDVPAPAEVLQARRNAQARVELLKELGAYTSAELAELAGSVARNPSALAGRWRSERKVLAVNFHGRAYYPAFQFDVDARPLPVVATVLPALEAAGFSAWEMALWFTSAHGRLAGRRPVDLLREQPDAVTALAQAESAELVG